VEEYFLTNGLKLNPIYHVRYWMGLTTTTPGSAAAFKWTDNITPAPVGQYYKNWGVERSVFADATTFPEPNNRYGPETCAGADFLQRQTQVYTPAYDSFNGTNFTAWGWADNNCTRRLAYICKIWPRERLPYQSCHTLRCCCCGDLSVHANVKLQAAGITLWVCLL
jgi:hypothetical protein